MGFFNRHDIEDPDPVRQHDKKSRVGMGDIHPAYPVAEQFDVPGVYRIFKLDEVGLDDPPVFFRQPVYVPKGLPSMSRRRFFHLVLKNPLGCTSYRSAKKHHPPVEKVREMYTAKFVYENAKGKRIGTGQDMHDSIDGYQYGIAAVISNMANIAAHGGKAKHVPGADLSSVTLKCHDPDGELFFLSIARDRVTLSSYSDEGIRARVEAWADGVPGVV
jgi:hypothetical protein